jgi:hypothetical protein
MFAVPQVSEKVARDLVFCDPSMQQSPSLLGTYAQACLGHDNEMKRVAPCLILAAAILALSRCGGGLVCWTERPLSSLLAVQQWGGSGGRLGGTV